VYRIRTPNGLHLTENDPSQNTTRRAQRDDGGKCAVQANNVSDDGADGAQFTQRHQGLHPPACAASQVEELKIPS
jgi:hypothetical protein